MYSINNRGYMCTVKRDIGETEEKFSERILFITNQKPKTQKEYNTAVLYSRLYINKKYFKCVYENSLEQVLIKKEKLMW